MAVRSMEGRMVGRMGSMVGRTEVRNMEGRMEVQNMEGRMEALKLSTLQMLSNRSNHKRCIVTGLTMRYLHHRCW